MFTFPRRDYTDDRATPQVDNPFVHHRQVRHNEAVIWDYVTREIENTIDHVHRHGHIHVLEIGGASLQGLKTLSKSPVFGKIRYTIVDSMAPYDQSLIDSTGAIYLRTTTHALDAKSLSPLNFVIAVRALEYDPNYEKTLRFLRSVSLYPSYGIFVHNAERSKAFQDVQSFIGILKFRVLTYPLATRVLRAELNMETALSLASEESRYVPTEAVAKEYAKFHSWLRKLMDSQGDTGTKITQINEKVSLYDRHLRLVYETYGERLLSRRFWPSDDENRIASMYADCGVVLLQRANAHLQDSGIRVHIDLVDLYNAWARAPHPLPREMIPTPTEIDIELR